MSDLLGIGSSGITAYQRALATVSNNIANVNTEGYSRQDVGQSATAPRLVGTNYLGTGTVFTGVRRQYDAFIEQNLRNSNSELQSQGPMVTYVNRLIDVMGNQSIGLTSALNQFFTSARDLASDPASTVQRSTFLRDADGLAARFRQLDAQMALLDTETRQTVESDVGQVNSLTRQLAEVNRQMARSATLDRQPSELLDQRDNLLRQLSEFISVKTSYASNGAVLVSVGDVQNQGILVNGPKSFDIGVAEASATDPERIRFVLDPYGTPKSLPNILSGKIGGLLNFRDSVLLPAAEALDGLASTLADEVNAAHRSGLDLQGRVGLDLFTVAKTGRGAAAGLNLALTDANRVAAAGQFRVTDDPLNVGDAQATIRWAQPTYTGGSALAGDLALGVSPVIAQASFNVGSLQPFLSLGAIAMGSQDTVLTLKAPQSGQSLQVLTRDGRHLLGKALDPQDQGRLMTTANGMEAGATYDASRLGQSFLGMNLFLGARAGPQMEQRFDASGKPKEPEPTPAILRASAVPTGLGSQIATGTFSLNGTSLPALDKSPAALTLDDLVKWINDANVNGIQAAKGQITLANGSKADVLTLKRPAGDLTGEIRLGLGPNGAPTDMARLGMDYAVHVSGVAADDLLVFVTNEDGVSAKVNATASFGASESDWQATLRQRPMTVSFHEYPSTRVKYYVIQDKNSGDVVAVRNWDPQSAAINYRGLTVKFSADPQPGDKFSIDGNTDGIGNNEAMLALADLEDAEIMPGGLTMTEAYIEQVNQVANIAQQAGIAQSALNVVYQQAVEARDGISGVSLDEEAAALVRYQQAYQANAKVMQMAKELFDAILQVR